ncbi:MAG: 23S rRNA (guanosine(2251)-2'-O)-methyltransferase RlmB [Clostridia bacterium]|nr:23S rRNA (guanosine(2251)-2'-O)-methyltransferase RlmB [Clostridia bacterium]
MENIVFGRNAVTELLKGDRDTDKILIAKGIDRNGDIERLAKQKKIVISYVEKQKLDEITEKGNHQGVCAYVSQIKYAQVSDILKLARDRNEPPFVIILDEITDPHNLGAVMRTACSAGCHGIIMPKRRSCPVNGTVSKVAAGAAEHLLVARVSNLASSIDALKKEGMWIVGGDMNGEQNYFDADLTGSLGIIVGNEGEGISRLLKEKCDFLVKIPMPGKTESLNVSVAAAVLTYESLRQRMKK